MIDVLIAQRWTAWPPIHDKLTAILSSWEGTPYMKGQRQKGVGVDCVRFVCAVLDELYGYERSHGPTWPHDGALHDRLGAVRTMRQFMSIFPCEAVEDGTMQPGDVLVVGFPNAGPGHALLVGPRPNELWHASQPAVHKTGIAIPQIVHRVLRSKDRVSWC